MGWSRRESSRQRSLATAHRAKNPHILLLLPRIRAGQADSGIKTIAPTTLLVAMTSRPHDALFKAAFAPPQHAAGLIRTIVPESVCASLHWDTLTLEPGSFIDQQLADRHTDLLFSACLDGTRCGSNERAYLYLLLEHFSTNVQDVPMRLHEYVIRIYKDLRRQGLRDPLPLILPMVVARDRGVSHAGAMAAARRSRRADAVRQPR